VTLADQPDGTYRIQANGHGTAGYIVNVFTYDNTGAPQEVFQAGNTSPGEIDLFDISVTGGGNIAGSTPAGTCSALSGTLLLTIVSNTIHWSPLAGAAGDFTVSTQACLANNVGGAQVPWPGAPTAGSAWWAVARGRNCAGGGSYDEGIGPSQQGGRDAEIGQAAAHCP
jgi:hypothetical protein